MIYALLMAAAISLYPDAGIITALDVDADIVTYETYNGNVFEFYGVEDYEVGDMVATIMFDNGTAEVADDEIVSVSYAGYYTKGGED